LPFMVILLGFCASIGALNKMTNAKSKKIKFLMEIIDCG
jgi:hypothetical protein